MEHFNGIDWAFLAWYALAQPFVFALAMMLWPAANHWFARQCGAVPGQSLSAYLYERELEGEWAGKPMRSFVDFIYSFWQSNHCQWAYNRWRLEAGITT